MPEQVKARRREIREACDRLAALGQGKLPVSRRTSVNEAQAAAASDKPICQLVFTRQPNSRHF